MRSLYEQDEREEESQGSCRAGMPERVEDMIVEGVRGVETEKIESKMMP